MRLINDILASMIWMNGPRPLASHKVLIACCLFLLLAGLAVHFVMDVTSASAQPTPALHLHWPFLLEPFLTLTLLLTLSSIRFLPHLIPNHRLQPPTTPPPISA